jgi:hypothetical protein
LVLDNLPLILFAIGLALFVVGDVLWLVRNTFNRPMNMRLTGVLVGAGILLICVGLIAVVATAGN